MSLDVDVPKAGVRRVEVAPLIFGSSGETRTRTTPWNEEAPWESPNHIGCGGAGSSEDVHRGNIALQIIIRDTAVTSWREQNICTVAPSSEILYWALIGFKDGLISNPPNIWISLPRVVRPISTDLKTAIQYFLKHLLPCLENINKNGFLKILPKSVFL